MSLRGAAVLLGATLALGSPARAEPKRELVVAALGTSLTARGGWLPALEHELEACREGAVRTANFGQSGATSRAGPEQARKAAALRPDVVLIEFAINDANLRRAVSLAESERNLKATIAATRRARPDARIYLLTMSPARGLRGLLRPRFNDYVALHRRVAKAEKVAVIDTLPRWRALSATEFRAAVPDGSHPQPAAFQRIALPLISQRLAADAC